MMESYSFLAAHYDALTRDVDYDKWAGYYISNFEKNRRPVTSVLDLGCGTGGLSWSLSRRGYEVIGVDSSPDMLTVAASKGFENAPMFLCQSMSELDLYGTVDAAVCMLDAVNYVTEPDELLRVFQRVLLFLEPGGIFIFDIISPRKFKEMDGGLFLDETDEVFCVWRAEFQKRICTYYIDVFEKSGKLWRRGSELHREYAYEISEITELLLKAGFENPETFGHLSFEPPVAGEERIFFRARKGKS